MRKRRRILSLILVMLCMPVSGAQKERSVTPRFILLTPFVEYAFFDPMKQGAADAAKALGVEARFTGVQDGDVKALAQQAREALTDGYDGVALNMIDASAFDAVAEEAAAKRVPLISFNVDDSRTPNARLAAVGQNMPEAGRMFGHAMAPLVPAGAHVLLTMHDAGITALEERAAGAKEALEPHGLRWTILITGTNNEAAVSKVKAVLAADASIRVVLGTGEADTQAAGLAIERYFKDKGLVAAGFDTSSEILRLVRDDVLHLTIDQQPYAQGYFAVVNLALAHRHGLKPASIDTGAAIVRKPEAANALRPRLRKSELGHVSR